MPDRSQSRPSSSSQGRKPRGSSADADDRRDALLTQVAERYYDKHETQDEIARAIGRSVATVSRLLTRAEDAGLVEMDVAQPHTLVPALQAALVKRFGIRVARVVHISPAETHTVVPRIGDFAARYLATVLGHESTLAISWGAHVQAVALAMPAMALRDAHVVQAVGSRGATMPQLVHPRLVQSLAMRLDATPHFLPAPMFAETLAERETIARDPYFGVVLDRIAGADVALVGIGSTSTQHSALYRAGILDEWELERVRSQGAVGEMLAEFFDIQGRIVRTDVSRRVVGMRAEGMRQVGTVVGVSSGEFRAESILGALRSGIVDVLVTDSLTTRAVLALADEHPTPTFAISQPGSLPVRNRDEPCAEAERAMILRAALCELDRVGYQKLSPTMIASEAHVPPEQIYRHWGSRAELVGDAWRQRQGYVHSHGETLREDLERLLYRIPEEEATTHDPYLASRTMAAEAQLDPEFQRVFSGLERASAGYVQDALRRALQRGELAPGCDLDVVADMVLGAIWYRLLFAKRPLDAQFAKDLTELVLKAVTDSASATASSDDAEPAIYDRVLMEGSVP